MAMAKSSAHLREPDLAAGRRTSPPAAVSFSGRPLAGRICSDYAQDEHVGFLLSCYDAHLRYDQRTHTFTARYPPHGRKPAKEEEGVQYYSSTSISIALTDILNVSRSQMHSLSAFLDLVPHPFHLSTPEFLNFLTDIVMDKPGGEGAPKHQMIDCYIHTLAKVLGRVCLNTSFGCAAGIPDNLFVLPDSYIDPEHKDCGGIS
ncbi:hypothetical protein ZWY2020_016346 [Hordeum vulgare]|nr:hypothetical protein ZWY2020_016346 [Hordeum vulgare]